jgi:hypothetical protein
MLLLNFAAPTLEELAVLEFLQHAATCSFTDDAAVWGRWQTVVVVRAGIH